MKAYSFENSTQGGKKPTHPFSLSFMSPKRHRPSVDLRAKVLRAVDQGYAREETVKLLGVSRATIKRYLKQRPETGTIAPKAIPGWLPKKLVPLQAELVAQLQAHDDLRLEDHCRLWEQSHGVRVSTAMMSRAIKRIGWTRKKRRGGAKRLVVVDESEVMLMESW